MNGNVLVVEDDQLSQYVIVEMCKELGFQCLTASDGQEALEIITMNAANINVVLMDIHMPVLSGLGATKAIRNYDTDPPKGIPLVATTADVQWHNPRRCIEFGFNSVLAKPVGFSELSDTLNRFA